MDLELFFQILPDLIVRGLPVTASLSALSLVSGFLLAVPLVFLGRSSRVGLRALGAGYVFLFRGVPLLLQIVFLYYGLALLPAVRLVPGLWSALSEPFVCASLALSLNTAAYTSEIMRGALNAIPRGEIDAAHALGMGRWLVFSRIIVPRAVRLGLPAYTNEIILMIKSSSLASAITLLDVMGLARKLYADDYAPVEAFLAAAVVYLVVILSLTKVFRRIERYLTFGKTA